MWSDKVYIEHSLSCEHVLVHGSLDMTHAQRIFIAMCNRCFVCKIISAVHYCHSKHIVHRDLKVCHFSLLYLW